MKKHPFLFCGLIGWCLEILWTGLHALPAEELARAARKYNSSAESTESIQEAVNKALTLAKEEDVILAFGSLSFIGELTKAVQDEKNRN